MLARSCSKSFKLGFNCVWNYDLDEQAWFKEGRESEIKLPTSSGSQKKVRKFQKTSISASLTILKPLIVWVSTNCGKFLNRWNMRPPYLPSEKPVYRSRSNSYNQIWNKRLVPNWQRREYIRAVCYHPAYLTYTQSKVRWSLSVVSDSLQHHGL